MREIKFRVWDNINKNMRYDIAAIDFELNRISFKNLENRIASENYREFWDLPYELMQYTGLKDANGIEIYEGDIVNHFYRYYVGMDEVSEEMEVVEIKDLTHLPFDLSTIGYEAIGNVYENKELLEGERK